MTLTAKDTSEPGSARTPSWLKWALIASLAVNLLIVGGAVGHRMFGHHGARGGERGGEDFGILGYARTLGSDRRAIIRKAVQTGKPDLKALRDEIRKARIEAGGVLVNEPFDKEKVRSALGRIGEAESRLKAAGLSAFLNAAEQLTPAERSGLLEWWKRRRPHHFRTDPGRADESPDK